MAHYAVGHKARVAEIEQGVRRIPGLHPTGSAYYGIGIPDCVRMGKEVVAGKIVRVS